MPTYTDKQIRDKGYLYIPEQQYLADPFKLPTTDDGSGDEGGDGGGGIPYTNAGNDFSVYNPDPNSIVNKNYDPYRYRNAIENSFLYGGSNATDPKYLNQSYDPSGKIANAQTMYNKASADLKDPFNRLALTKTFTGMRPSKQVMDYYNEQIMDNKEQYGVEGQYETVPSELAYSSQTELNKFKDNYPGYFAPAPLEGIPGAAQSYLKNSFLGKGLNIAKDILNNFLPTSKRRILENELGGQGLLVNDIGQFVAGNKGSAYDPSGANIMAGYNAYHVDADTFAERRAKAKEKMTPEGFKKLDIALTAAEKKFLDAKKKSGIVEDDEEIEKKKKLSFFKKKKEVNTTTDDTTTDGTTTDGTDGGTTTGSGYTGDFANIDNSGKNYGPYTQTSYAPQYTAQDDARERQRDTSGEGNNTGGSTDSGSKDNSKGGMGSAGFGGMFHGADGGRVYFFDGGRVAVMNGGLISLL